MRQFIPKYAAATGTDKNVRTVKTNRNKTQSNIFF